MGILGTGVTTTAIAVAVSAGGVGVLNKLRDYEIEEVSNTKAILKLKK